MRAFDDGGEEEGWLESGGEEEDDNSNSTSSQEEVAEEEEDVEEEEDLQDRDELRAEIDWSRLRFEVLNWEDFPTANWNEIVGAAAIPANLARLVSSLRRNNTNNKRRKLGADGHLVAEDDEEEEQEPPIAPMSEVERKRWTKALISVCDILTGKLATTKMFVSLGGYPFLRSLCCAIDDEELENQTRWTVAWSLLLFMQDGFTAAILEADPFLVERLKYALRLFPFHRDIFVCLFSICEWASELEKINNSSNNGKKGSSHKTSENDKDRKDSNNRNIPITLSALAGLAAETLINSRDELSLIDAFRSIVEIGSKSEEFVAALEEIIPARQLGTIFSQALEKPALADSSIEALAVMAHFASQSWCDELIGPYEENFAHKLVCHLRFFRGFHDEMGAIGELSRKVPRFRKAAAEKSMMSIEDYISQEQEERDKLAKRKLKKGEGGGVKTRSMTETAARGGGLGGGDDVEMEDHFQNRQKVSSSTATATVENEKEDDDEEMNHRASTPSTIPIESDDDHTVKLDTDTPCHCGDCTERAARESVLHRFRLSPTYPETSLQRDSGVQSLADLLSHGFPREWQCRNAALAIGQLARGDPAFCEAILGVRKQKNRRKKRRSSGRHKSAQEDEDRLSLRADEELYMEEGAYQMRKKQPSFGPSPCFRCGLMLHGQQMARQLLSMLDLPGGRLASETEVRQRKQLERVEKKWTMHSVAALAIGNLIDGCSLFAVTIGHVAPGPSALARMLWDAATHSLIFAQRIGLLSRCAVDLMAATSTTMAQNPRRRLENGNTTEEEDGENETAFSLDSSSAKYSPMERLQHEEEEEWIWHCTCVLLRNFPSMSDYFVDKSKYNLDFLTALALGVSRKTKLRAETRSRAKAVCLMVYNQTLFSRGGGGGGGEVCNSGGGGDSSQRHSPSLQFQLGEKKKEEIVFPLSFLQVQEKFKILIDIGSEEENEGDGEEGGRGNEDNSRNSNSNSGNGSKKNRQDDNNDEDEQEKRRMWRRMGGGGGGGGGGGDDGDDDMGGGGGGGGGRRRIKKN